MKIYISYFAQIRNFPPNLVGLSTAVWNPKWLQKGRSQNGIIWLDIPPLKPGKNCDGLCNGKCSPKHPNNCNFLREYKNQLDKIDFNMLMEHLQVLSETIKVGEQFNDVDFALLVYEKYDNICSERWPLIQWFKEHNMELKEWQLDKNQ